MITKLENEEKERTKKRATTTISGTTPQHETPKRNPGFNTGFDDLVEEDHDLDFGAQTGGYIPSVKSTAPTQNTNNSMTDELKNKKKQLFNIPDKRPLTQETKPTTTGLGGFSGSGQASGEDVPEINIKSRRKGNRAATTVDAGKGGARPMTSPSVLNKPEFNIQDDKS